MANLTPVSRNDDIVMLELSDFVKGGQNGKSNEQAQQLLNKFTWFNRYMAGRESVYTLLKNEKLNIIQSLRNSLLLKIELLKGKSDVSDVVPTYAALMLYDTSKLYDNNIVKVLADETHDRLCSYYRWHTSTQQFTFIGTENIVMPIIISSNETISPDDDYTYVISNAIITLGTGYDGCVITVVAATACSVVYSGNTYNCSAGEVIQLFYVNNTWYKKELDILNLAYPIGYVYISLENISPAVFLGGTWESIDSGRILISAGTTYVSGSNGGNSSISITVDGSVAGHSLTLGELPSHSHASVSFNTSGVSQNHAHTYLYTTITTTSAKGGTNTRWRRSTGSQTTGGISANHTHSFNVASGGVTGANGTAHDHPLTINNSFTIDIIQKSYRVYMWRRTA